MPVAHDTLASSVVTEVVELGQDLWHFEFEGALQELPCALTHEFVEGRESGRAMVVWVPSDMGRTFSLEL
jgi:hypothetical protein